MLDTFEAQGPSCPYSLDCVEGVFSEARMPYREVGASMEL